MSQEPSTPTVMATHAHNLACRNAVKRCKMMKDALETTCKITKLIKKSPEHEATFKSLQTEMVPETDLPGIRLLCPTMQMDCTAKIVQEQS